MTEPVLPPQDMQDRQFHYHSSLFPVPDDPLLAMRVARAMFVAETLLPPWAFDGVTARGLGVWLRRARAAIAEIRRGGA